jgi:hypothetical protein
LASDGSRSACRTSPVPFLPRPSLVAHGVAIAAAVAEKQRCRFAC